MCKKETVNEKVPSSKGGSCIVKVGQVKYPWGVYKPLIVGVVGCMDGVLGIRRTGQSCSKSCLADGWLYDDKHRLG